MMRTACFLLFGLSLAVGTEAQFDRSCPAAANILQREPIVIWDVTGWDFLGQLIHGKLVVYNDGVASVSSLSTGDVRTKFVNPADAQGLSRDLIQAGAMTLCDQGCCGADMPLTTLTVLSGGTDARAHTFSYWGADNEYAAVQAEIDDFLATHFPGFSVY